MKGVALWSYVFLRNTAVALPWFGFAQAQELRRFEDKMRVHSILLVGLGSVQAFADPGSAQGDAAPPFCGAGEVDPATFSSHVAKFKSGLEQAENRLVLSSSRRVT